MSLANLTSSILGPEPVAGVWFPSVCPSMQAVERIVSNLGNTRLPVLLLGEPGSGKDALAQRIHAHSALHGGGCLKVVCGEETVLSFTGLLGGLMVGNGHGPRPSVQAATLFLDGIEELNEECQARLLQAMPDAGVNGSGHVHLAARLICAANGSLEEKLARAQFSEALYFRICGLCLRIPPLRHRREDILPLLDFFLSRLLQEQGGVGPELSAAARAQVLRYTWPGNLRELHQFARQVLATGDSSQALRNLAGSSETAPEPPRSEPTPSLKEVARAAARQAEKELILKTLARTRWNRKRAAEELRISYKALLYKLKEISPAESPGEGA